ncbi:MAG: ABC transporter ATP-binding protein [Thermoanaerobaculia bacterium]
MSEPVLSARGLSKAYRVYSSSWDRLFESLTRRSRHRRFTALEDVSFDLLPGESLGIIGENGAGKSTLLKILAGIVQPSAGGLEVRGKVASILELGSGFHPELTGRQNITLNAAMLGLDHEEIRERTPRIIAWSELESFIDQPVKCYSTGMAMRLGFAIATEVDPDILIIDEALSVGDGYFQKKCVDRLLTLVAAGKTLLFCSHAMYYVTAFCHRALWLRDGQVAALGPAQQVVHEYERFLLGKSARSQEAEPKAAVGPARIRAVKLDRAEGPYRPGEPLRLTVEWQSEDRDLGFHLGVGINRIDEVELCSFATHLDGLSPSTGRLRYSASLAIPELPIVKGEFTLYVFLLDEAGLHIYDQAILRSAFKVESPGYAFGLVQVDHSWQLAAPLELAHSQRATA